MLRSLINFEKRVQLSLGKQIWVNLPISKGIMSPMDGVREVGKLNLHMWWAGILPIDNVDKVLLLEEIRVEVVLEAQLA
jgi:hypothetical protein